MECTVRYVREVEFRDDEVTEVGTMKPALCFRGVKIAHAVINDDSAVRTIDIPLESHDKASPVLYHGTPYDPKAYADRLLMSAKAASKPITRRARILLVNRDIVLEDSLPPDDMEPLEQVRVYADNTPTERLKAAKRPGPVVNKTEEFKKHQPIDPVQALTETLFPSRQKDAKKGANGKAAPVTRIDVAKAHKDAREAIAKPAIEKAKPTLPHSERGNLIKKIAAELKMEPFDLRVIIRSTGMRAPYEDEKKIRKAIKGKIPARAKA